MRVGVPPFRGIKPLQLQAAAAVASAPFTDALALCINDDVGAGDSVRSGLWPDKDCTEGAFTNLKALSFGMVTSADEGDVTAAIAAAGVFCARAERTSPTKWRLNPWWASAASGILVNGTCCGLFSCRGTASGGDMSVAATALSEQPREPAVAVVLGVPEVSEDAWAAVGNSPNARAEPPQLLRGLLLSMPRVESWAVPPEPQASTNSSTSRTCTSLVPELDRSSETWRRIVTWPLPTGA